MARRLDPAQQSELTAFVNDLYEAAGYETTAEWARESGVWPPNLSKLRNGKTGVDGYNLLRLIRAAALRSQMNPEDLAQATASESPDSIRTHLATLTKLVTRALELLEPPNEPPEHARHRGRR